MREALQRYVKRVQDLVEHVRGDEQATKKSLVGPLFTVLGGINNATLCRSMRLRTQDSPSEECADGLSVDVPQVWDDVDPFDAWQASA